MKSGWPIWKGDLAETAEILRAEAARFSADDLAAALDHELQARFEALVDGIQKYRAHPYRRPTDDRRSIWQSGTTRLLDYGPVGGRPVLVVPSLVNRGYILDLMPEVSMLRFLAEVGLRPMLIDWGAPGDAERGFDVANYVTQRLEPALDIVQAIAGASASGSSPLLLGYCMGGNLALALAVRRQQDIGGLALLATPWDFHASDAPAPFVKLFAQAISQSDAWLADAWLDQVPTDLLQMLFATIDPLRAIRKFTGFAGLDQNSAEAIRFVAIEDWANDGVPLSLPVASECFIGWYGENRPARGLWRIGDMTIEPAGLNLPSISIVPRQDSLVPELSALALSQKIRGNALVRPDTGHIGMIVGRNARAACWEPLVGWVRRLPV